MLLVAAIFTACVGVEPLVVTGKSLAALGNTVANTNAAMTASLDAKTISPEQYRNWATFARRFKEHYPFLVQMWSVARLNEDKVLEAEIAAILARLSAELAAFRPQAAVNGGK